jgi:hypothetical protein
MGQLGIRDNTLDPETLKMLGAVYDLAVASLHDSRQRSLIAERIMMSAMKGERDLHRLCGEALRGIRLPR